LQVDEKNLPLLQVGSKALAVADAFPTERFEAVIAYLSPGVDAARGTVELRLDIPQPPAFLKSDMTVSVDITGPLLKQAVFAPADSVRQLQSDAPYVVLDREGVAAKAPVRLGLQMQGKVQLVKGVEAGERLVLTRDVEPGVPGVRLRERK
jgi:HlyD family secretion protein